jgi:hypothetical protein
LWAHHSHDEGSICCCWRSSYSSRQTNRRFATIVRTGMARANSHAILFFYAHVESCTEAGPALHRYVQSCRSRQCFLSARLFTLAKEWPNIHPPEPLESGRNESCHMPTNGMHAFISSLLYDETKALSTRRVSSLSRTLSRSMM